jgi:hypothetical protein
VPALPATPRPRILLALRRAVAARDQATIAAVIHTGQREQPDWDPTEELPRIGPWAAGPLATTAQLPSLAGPGRPPGQVRGG